MKQVRPQVLIRSVRQPGVTKLVAPVYADILTKLKLFTRVEEAEGSPPADSKPGAKRYRRRDMQAEKPGAPPAPPATAPTPDDQEEPTPAPQDEQPAE